MKALRAQLLVASELDNSSFYLPWLQELGIGEIGVATLPPAELPGPWFPAILLSAVPATGSQLHVQAAPYAFGGESWLVLEPGHSFHNRVLPLSQNLEQGLQIFTQPGCFACQTLIRKFKRQGAEFEVLNQSSELWHLLGIRRTPAFLWQGHYFFENPQGLRLTALARFLPSAGA
ncbi:MAG: hypothetical protein ACAI44_15335 [Candidatus Sericytochromatia bacterium]